MFLFDSRRADLLAAKQRVAYQLRRTRERKRQINERYDYGCSECGVGGRLHLHHIRALSQGGTHRLENIALLCEDCHSAAHGGRTFRYQDRDKPTTIEKKITLINRALSQRKDIRFRYQKPDGSITQRTVTPHELRKLTVAELRTLVGRNAKIEKEGTLFPAARRWELGFALQVSLLRNEESHRVGWFAIPRRD
jgi:HNH endonuclease